MHEEMENKTTIIQPTENVIITAFNKWSDKKWFQVLFIFVIVYLLVSPILSPVVSNIMQRERTSVTMNETLDIREQKAAEEHKNKYEQSIQSYAHTKKVMSSYLNEIGCEYMFLIEYHNGNENVITGIQFCRFDVTIEVSKPGMNYVPVEKFKDDIVARYDILLSDELGSNKILFYTKDEFESVDRYLAFQLGTIDAQSFAILNLRDMNGKVFGSILCASTNDTMNLLEVLSCARDIENIMNNVF